MAVLDLLFSERRPGWMTRERGRKYVEICALAVDVLVEGLNQARLALLGHDPPPDAIPHASRDRGIVAALTELPRDTALRFRRWLWSWRAAGLPGVADAVVHGDNWSNRLPYRISGRPTEDGLILRVVSGGIINTTSVTYTYSTNGGASYAGPFGTSSTSEFVFGDLSLFFETGDVWTTNDELVIAHGGRGLVLNDLGAPTRSGDAGSPAGDESLLYEIAKVVGDCKIQLVSMSEAATPDPLPAKGTWWTREADGTVWRLPDGPWAWEAEKDLLSTQWARGLVIITNPPNIAPWELLGSDAHYLGEPDASYGTTAITEWWNRLSVTISNFKPAHMLVLSVIVNFDATKFDPTIPATCPQDNWYHTHEYSGSGIAWTRPVEYAWFSGPM